MGRTTIRGLDYRESPATIAKVEPQWPPAASTIAKVPRPSRRSSPNGPLQPRLSRKSRDHRECRAPMAPCSLNYRESPATIAKALQEEQSTCALDEATLTRERATANCRDGKFRHFLEVFRCRDFRGFNSWAIYLPKWGCRISPMAVRPSKSSIKRKNLPFWQIPVMCPTICGSNDLSIRPNQTI